SNFSQIDLDHRYEIELRGADEVVLRQPADGMRRENDAAVVVADFKVWMVVLDVGEMCDRVHEAHRAVEVLERELATDGTRIRGQGPALIELSKQQRDPVTCQGRHAAITRLALLLRQVGHVPTAASVAVL